MADRVLLIDDNEIVRDILVEHLETEGYKVAACPNGYQGLDLFKNDRFDLVILDLIMPGINGIEVLKEIKRISPHSVVILITGFGSVESAIDAMRAGAFDYITKPFNLSDVNFSVRRGIDVGRLKRENVNLKRQLKNRYGFENMIGDPNDMQNILTSIVNQYLPRIKYYANKMSINLPTELSKDDLVSAGIIGLLEAVERYDCKKEASLKTFSDLRIKGAIIDEIRSMQWASRDVRKKLSAVRETYKRLEGRLSRPPTNEEAAKELGIGINELNAVLLTSNMNSLRSLHDTVIGSSGETKELIDCISSDKETNPAESFELKESITGLINAIKSLSPREKLIVSLYYFEELTLKEIGNVVGLTESRICQILNETILKLKKNINKTKSFRDI
ncbi:MAG: FliA/WhiG family RNA polymerase sigma factor [Nitrospirae bacterium]|nr:FliA/WhiG family RNA polymerase sigma factor [Nitrospirota bacterium]